MIPNPPWRDSKRRAGQGLRTSKIRKNRKAAAQPKELLGEKQAGYPEADEFIPDGLRRVRVVGGCQGPGCPNTEHEADDDHPVENDRGAVHGKQPVDDCGGKAAHRSGGDGGESSPKPGADEAAEGGEPAGSPGQGGGYP